MGAHQKIDRTARNLLEHLAPACPFPRTKTILHFEGNNGPDAIKRKSPAKDGRHSKLPGCRMPLLTV
jgi:hypothetical protein